MPSDSGSAGPRQPRRGTFIREAAVDTPRLSRSKRNAAEEFFSCRHLRTDGGSRRQTERFNSPFAAARVDPGAALPSAKRDPRSSVWHPPDWLAATVSQNPRGEGHRGRRAAPPHRYTSRAGLLKERSKTLRARENKPFSTS